MHTFNYSTRRAYDGEERTADTPIDESCKERSVDHGCSPLRVVTGSRLGGYDLVHGLSFGFERGDLGPDGDQHVAKFDELIAVADRSVAWNDDGLIFRHFDVGVRGRDSPIDAAACDIIDERICTIPEGVTGLQDIGSGEIDRHVAVRMAWPIMADQYRFPI